MIGKLLCKLGFHDSVWVEDGKSMGFMRGTICMRLCGHKTKAISFPSPPEWWRRNNAISSNLRQNVKEVDKLCSELQALLDADKAANKDAGLCYQ